MSKKLVKSKKLVGKKSTKTATKKETEDFLEQLEAARFERIEKMMKEREEHKRAPKPPEKTHEEYLRESVERHERYEKSEGPRWLERQKLLKSVPKSERLLANDQIGTVSITSNEKSTVPDYEKTFESIDYLTFEEMDTPLKVRWNREQELKSWGYKYGKPYLVIMSPDEFLLFAHELTDPMTSKVSLESIRDGIVRGNTFDTPFLYVDANGVATGRHEGRHRARVLKSMGVKRMPVLVYDERQKYGTRIESNLHRKLKEAYT